MLVLVRGDELAQSSEGLEGVARFAASLEDEGRDSDVDTVEKVGGVVGREGPSVEEDGVTWRGETEGQDVWAPCGGVYGDVLARIFIVGGRGRRPWERGEGAYWAETEVALHAGAELGEVGERARKVVVGVGGGVDGEGKVELLVVVVVWQHRCEG